MDHAFYAAHRELFDAIMPETPCLLLSLDVVADRYRELRAGLPDASVYYAVKANADPELLRHLVGLGCGFDVASVGEVDACLTAGADPASISFGNTVKKESAIRHAHERGVRLYSVDSAAELEKVARAAPGAEVCCRFTVRTTGAQWPISRKFGCTEEDTVELLRDAVALGLTPRGTTFHVGSQQREPDSWATGVAAAARVSAKLATEGIELDLLNLGGGLPVRYEGTVPPLETYFAAIDRAVSESFATRPALIVEPGRYLPGDAGMIRSEVVLVTEREDGLRWVYLDVGRYNGLIETDDEAIAFPVVAVRADGRFADERAPVVLAGPTCDSTDILYERTPVWLPVDLRPGDHVDILATGAYTTPYASVGFNGFPPLPTHCFGTRGR
ncbi:type III PLP-dependent enzyme [Saccharothrix sp. Mg75]|uniref:type III PLP-dependent enzyme n=1 Tax=Saccharothrix sp. Mg75 TaxID=3445357 RepID=UPI003EEAB2AB